MLWAEKTARNRKKQQIFQSKDEILNKMGRENSQMAQFWQIFSAYNSYNAYDVEVKRSKILTQASLYRTSDILPLISCIYMDRHNAQGTIYGMRRRCF